MSTDIEAIERAEYLSFATHAQQVSEPDGARWYWRWSWLGMCWHPFDADSSELVRALRRTA